MEPLGKEQVKVEQLLGLLAGVDRLLILTHDNPDPDAMSSVAALRHLIEERAAHTKVYAAYSGMLGRSENRAMMRLLNLNIKQMKNLKLLNVDAIALVDTQPGAGNNILPREKTPLIIIDHHPLRPNSKQATFIDIRPEAGTTVGIMTEYLRAAKVTIPANLSTALAYGVISETQDLGRQATQEDVDSFVYLFPKVNQKLLARIRWAKVPKEFYHIISKAVDTALIFKNIISVKLGQVQNPDMIPLIADFLLRLERISWSVVTGLCRNRLFISIRSSNINARAGGLIRKALAGRGSAGGHTMSSGGQIDLRRVPQDERLELEDKIMASLLNVMRVKDRSRMYPLLGVPSKGNSNGNGRGK